MYVKMKGDTVMKKIIALILAFALCLICAACGGAGTGPLSDGGQTGQTDSGAEDMQTLGCIIVSGGGTSRILVAEEKVGLFAVSLDETKISIGSEQSDFGSLKNGMAVEIVFDAIRETYPAGISPVTLKASGVIDENGDICGLYESIIKTLWETDTGLNDNGDKLYIDLSNAPGLSDTMKEAVRYLAGNLTGKTASAATFDELKERGIYDSEKMMIKDGCFISISGEAKSDSKLTISAQKYVSGLGAIFFNDGTAKKSSDGKWTFTPGDFAIA